LRSFVRIEHWDNRVQRVENEWLEGYESVKV